LFQSIVVFASPSFTFAQPYTEARVRVNSNPEAKVSTGVSVEVPADRVRSETPCRPELSLETNAKKIS
jgi:hypothetical protein